MIDAGMHSNSQIMRESKFYKQIVDLGVEAVVPILKMIKKEPTMLVWALFDITGENPIKYEHRGNIKEMTKDWLAWGLRNGYR